MRENTESVILSPREKYSVTINGVIESHKKAEEIAMTPHTELHVKFFFQGMNFTFNKLSNLYVLVNWIIYNTKNIGKVRRGKKWRRRLYLIRTYVTLQVHIRDVIMALGESEGSSPVETRSKKWRERRSHEKGTEDISDWGRRRTATPRHNSWIISWISYSHSQII